VGSWQLVSGATPDRSRPILLPAPSLKHSPDAPRSSEFESPSLMGGTGSGDQHAVFVDANADGTWDKSKHRTHVATPAHVATNPAPRMYRRRSSSFDFISTAVISDSNVVDNPTAAQTSSRVDGNGCKAESKSASSTQSSCSCSFGMTASELALRRTRRLRDVQELFMQLYRRHVTPAVAVSSPVSRSTPTVSVTSPVIADGQSQPQTDSSRVTLTNEVAGAVDKSRYGLLSWFGGYA